MAEFTLRQLQYFVAVVDHGSVTAAARQCSISQAAASMSISQLEHAVGVELLIRTRSKTVAPTQAGVELAARARRILGLAGEIGAAVAGAFDEMRGKLRIGCSATLSPRVLPRLVGQFHRNYPAVELTFREGAAARLQEDVRNGRLDAAFVYALQSEEDLDRIEVAQVRQHLMLPADHPLAGRREIRFQDVADEPAILLDIPPAIDRVVSMMQAAGVEPKLRWPSSNMETIRSLVAHGLGYSFVNYGPGPETAADHPGVVYIPIANKLPANPVVAMLPRGVKVPRRVAVAIDFVRAAAAETDRSG
ncbi:LysR family transcriptional regulator [Arthrobacter sp. GCM10027362]|uniref:LysR family transcriptional regulator n=1 Tax=Arthrobacter sp. GCM10027362 TaxID=3273379 RepID=UPI00363B3862